MVRARQPRKRVLRSPEEIPRFSSEAEEAVFWDSVDFGKEFWSKLQPLSPEMKAALRSSTKPIVIRVDDDVLERLRAIAFSRGKSYEALAKEFVVERLYEEEKRKGILPAAPSQRAES